MNASRLLEHFDRISEAPDAIPKLRRFILDLAVRGKLVKQDSNEESAEVLLERITSTRRLRVKAKRRGAEQNMGPVTDEEIPFPMPNGWAATRLATIADCLDYMREPVNSSARAQRIDGKAAADLYPYFGATQQQGWIDSYIFDDELVLLGEDGVPFFDELRQKAYVISGKTWVNNHAHVFRGIEVSAKFLAHSLNTFDYAGRVAGATRSKLNQANAVDIPIALPPLAEQHRIVAKVDELMGLCDRLEAAQREREARRDQLVARSLAEAPRASAPLSFFLQNSHRLLKSSDHLVALRGAAIELAIRGRLTAQMATDGDATALLGRLRSEGRAAPETASATAEVADRPFDIPTSWQWAALGDLILDSDAGWSPKSEGFPRTGENWGVIKVSAVSWDKFQPEENKQLLPGVVPPPSAQIHEGDFLISRANTSALVAKCVVVDDEPERLILSDKIVRLRLTPDCDKRYLALLNNQADYARAYYAREASGTSLSMKNVSRPVIYALPIPVPPLAEQWRIVATIDELLAVCDQLQKQLNAARTNGTLLLDALLQKTLQVLA